MKKLIPIMFVCLISISFVAAFELDFFKIDLNKWLTGNIVKGECSGTARPCSELGKNRCGESRDTPQFGCRWSEKESTCKGISWPCNGVRVKDQKMCEQQRGCSWKAIKEDTAPEYPKGALFQRGSTTISGYSITIRYFLLNRANVKITSPDGKDYIKWLRQNNPRKIGDAVVTLVDSGSSTEGRWGVIDLYIKVKEQATPSAQEDCGGQTGSHSCGSVHYCEQAGSPAEQKNYIDMAGDEGVKNKVNNKGWTARLIDPYIGGYIKYQGKAGQSNMQTKPDRCAGNKFLFETYCLNDGGNTKYEWHQTKIECPAGYECQEVNELGTCAKLKEDECTTDDECVDEDAKDCKKPACIANEDGIKKCVQGKKTIPGCGDECTEHSECEVIKCKQAICDDEDNDGKKTCRYEDDTTDPNCIENKTCTDTDNGAAAEPIKKGKYINFKKIGTAEGFYNFKDGKRWVRLTDGCKNKNTKTEYYCIDDKNIGTKTEKCEENERCIGGECILDTCYDILEEILLKHGIKF